jgi:regulator of nucleoside diphosphate kinase
MRASGQRPIVVTRADLERLRILTDPTRQSRRWEAAHLMKLAEELDDAEVVEPGEIAPDVVNMHSLVAVRDMVSGEVATYTLCYPVEADLDSGRLSVLAPVGAALVGNREGDVVTWPVPRGVRVLRIERVVHRRKTAARPALETTRQAVES